MALAAFPEPQAESAPNAPAALAPRIITSAGKWKLFCDQQGSSQKEHGYRKYLVEWHASLPAVAGAHPSLSAADWPLRHQR